MRSGSKTLRYVLLGLVDRVTVTRTTLSDAGVRVDARLLQAAGVVPHEKIELYDVTTGTRLSTFALPAEEGTGEVSVHGPEAHFVKPGDRLVLAAYGLMKEKAARKHTPRVVRVDAQNAIAAGSDTTDRRIESSRAPHD
jgi:aspartate 1-decarboxylase